MKKMPKGEKSGYGYGGGDNGMMGAGSPSAESMKSDPGFQSWKDSGIGTKGGCKGAEVGSGTFLPERGP